MTKPKSKRGVREYKLHMGTFDFTIVGIICDYKEAGKFVAWEFEDKEFNLDAWDKGYEPLGKCFFRRGYTPVIWLPRQPKTARERATFAHEALHAVFHLFEWANLSMNRETEEVAGHALGHIVSNLFSLPHIK